MDITNNMLKVSIVTAVYNRASTVGQSIESVQQQSYSNIEHVIQDGCSSDQTLEIIERYVSPQMAIESKPDSGLYYAINRGIERSTGHVIGLMHSDDFFPDNSVVMKIARAFDDPAVDGVYGDLQYVSVSDPERVIRHWKSGEYRSSSLRRGWMPPHPTLYLRRSVFERYGHYDTSFKISADYDAMLRYLGSGAIKMAYIPEVLVKMRAGGASNRSIKNIVQKSREDLVALRRNNVGGLGTLLMKNIRKIEQFSK